MCHQLIDEMRGNDEWQWSNWHEQVAAFARRERQMLPQTLTPATPVGASTAAV